MATDNASAELKEELANPTMSFYGCVREAARNVGIKCKMMCTGGKATSTPEDGDCPYTEEV